MKPKVTILNIYENAKDPFYCSVCMIRTTCKKVVGNILLQLCS
jgi:hypothetical protein